MVKLFVFVFCKEVNIYYLKMLVEKMVIIVIDVFFVIVDWYFEEIE